MSRMTLPLPQVNEHLRLDLADFPVSVAFSPRLPLLGIALSDGELALVDVANARLQQRLAAHTDSLHRLCWHPDGALLTSCDRQGNIRHWQVGTPVTAPLTPTGLWTSEQPWIEACAWRPDGRYLAVASGRQCQLFDRAGHEMHCVTFENSAIADIAWNPRGTELALAGYRGVDLISGAGKALRRRTLPWTGALGTLSWSPNGRILAACRQDNALHFWRVSSGRHAAMSGYPTKPRALAWSADSTYLVTGGSPAAITWTFAAGGPEGQPPVQLELHMEPVTAVAVDPRLHFVAVGCRGQRISLWHSAVAALPFFETTLPAPVEFLGWQAAGPGASWLAALDRSGHVGVWRVSCPV